MARHFSRYSRLLMLLILIALSGGVSMARWGKADLGYLTVAHACRDGALIVGQSESESAADVTAAVGARHYVNTSVALDDAFAPSPRPASDYGPDIVGALRPITVTTQPLVLDDEVAPGLRLSHRRYGMVSLLWNTALAPGARIALVYKRAIDDVEVVSFDALIEDCRLAATISQPVAATKLPGSPPAPGGALSYQLTSWPSHGLLRLGTLPLLVGNRFSVADTLSNPLNYASSGLSGDWISLDIHGIALASALHSASSKTASANNPALSADGRFVAFESLDPGLVAQDTNNAHDIFVFDRQTAATRIVSQGIGATAANDGSTQPSISADGRFVAFVSAATNLVANDSNGQSDIFVADLQAGSIRLVSRGINDTGANSSSRSPALSSDGRFVAFVSSANNLVTTNTNGEDNIFVADLQSGAISLLSAGISVAANAASEAPAISADGRFVAFSSLASNLVANDSNSQSDIFLADRQNGTITLLSQGLAGIAANGGSYAPSLSADGQLIAFESDASNLVTADSNGQRDVFVINRQQGSIKRVSNGPAGVEGDGPSTAAALSGDGRLVAFQTDATNLLGNDTNGAADCILYALPNGPAIRLSRGFAGDASNSSTLAPRLSQNGSLVAFESYASNLLPTPGSNLGDIYLVQRSQASVWVGAQQIFLPVTRR